MIGLNDACQIPCQLMHILVMKRQNNSELNETTNTSQTRSKGFDDDAMYKVWSTMFIHSPHKLILGLDNDVRMIGLNDDCQNPYQLMRS